MKTIRAIFAAVSTYLSMWSVVLAQAAQDAMLKNPLSQEFQTIPRFIEGALKVMVMVALPIITVFLVYAGFQFVLAQGNQESLTKAKRNFLYVIIGALLIMGAWIIATLIGGTVTQLTSV